MMGQIDKRPLNKWQWMVMFMGPDWDKETIGALSYSLHKAYEIHLSRIHAAVPTHREESSE
ncbi:hypothetical protein [Rhizobium grahamii]|uniref:Uncharacterized protein n=1 Tax=Rhizobium grahamii CCGE 502 TaxID=990285 RepID=S3HA82_9HYPH|nr:hypothetical protein [Rhizobium grahamii]EPE95747.1 hypothetical protein RGCCGE502_22895 [Rhizobium grahamii CCGE 502]